MTVDSKEGAPMTRLRDVISTSLAVVVVLWFAGVCEAAAVTALPKGPVCSDGEVTASANLIGAVHPVGYPVVGFTLGLEGRLLKFHVEFAAGVGRCSPPDEVHSRDDFVWTVTDPFANQ